MDLVLGEPGWLALYTDVQNDLLSYVSFVQNKWFSRVKMVFLEGSMVLGCFRFSMVFLFFTIVSPLPRAHFVTLLGPPLTPEPVSSPVVRQPRRWEAPRVSRFYERYKCQENASTRCWIVWVILLKILGYFWVLLDGFGGGGSMLDVAASAVTGLLDLLAFSP